MYAVSNIRNLFKEKLKSEDFVIDKSGVKTIDLIGMSFIADETAIFGTVNEDWNRRELAWYESMSLNVNDIEEPIPAIWKQVATEDGWINSNYGWCIFSKENHEQYLNVVKELTFNPDSRRGQMIYTRPTMHEDCKRNGMSDFICTAYTQHYIRNGKLITQYVMRSNDAIMGYKGDRAWAGHVHKWLAADLGVEEGDIIWTVSSLHVYERHFNLIK
jgi:thymidylate synthase